MNQPYVKRRDENGNVTNPIVGSYTSSFPNRRKRREHKNQIPFYGNGKNFRLTTDGRNKFKRVRQIEFDKDGDKKILYHYITH